jgi:DNA-binding transcriptional ArsR family regulator
MVLPCTTAALIREPGRMRSMLCMLDILLGIWQIGNMAIEASLRALANEKRLQILEWLKDPRAHFPPQVEGDLVKDGVCGVFIADKLGVSQPTASEHLKVLAQAGLIRGKRIKQWTFYKREEARIAELKRAISKSI